MTEEAALKSHRRTAKSKLTRTQNAVQFLLSENQPKSEVNESFSECKQAFDDVCMKHEEYTSIITDDDEFDKQEKWMDDCQQAFLKLKVKVNDYCKISENPENTQSTTEENPFVSPEQEPAMLVTSEENAEHELLQNLEDPELRPTHISNFKMEKPKMPKFSGDVRDYHVFKSDFLHAVGTAYSKRDAISLLRSCLQGKPAEMIRGIGSDYEAVWDYLDSVYGDPRFIADAIINDVNKFRNLKDGDDSRFCDLVHLIRRSYNTLREVGRPQDMDNSQMLALIERKLNADDRKVWFRYLERESKPASLTILLDWMTVEMKSRLRATAPVRCDSGKTGYAVNFAGKETEHVKPFYKCWVCESSSHWVDECKKLTPMTYQQRMELMKNNQACFCCLKKAGKGHRMTNCKRKKQCTEMTDGKQCQYFHHPLLHIPKESLTGSVGIALNESTNTLLPIVETEMVGSRGKRQRGNVLLDSGAEVSLIRSSMAERLKLSGRGVDVTITKLGGEQEQMQTKKFLLQIKSLSTNQVYHIHAIGLPNISESIKEVKLDATLERLNLRKSDVNRGSGPVDLLIGIDYARMHCGEVRQSGNVVARHSPLGWVVFGSCGGEQSYQRSVFHVKVTPPVDMTDFWSTESMGVQPQSCQCQPIRLSKVEQEEGKIIRESCQKVGNQWLVPYPWRKDPNLLPDNRVQVEKTLQSTEKKLLKNPAYAEVYNNQIKEMVEMKFARKLSEKEQANYKGPVHYVSHHAVVRPEKRSTPVRIVFNSSASFQSHCLNDYWMKGPDLLNNLFGVLLRFRQFTVAACGDISKMYHRFLIPEVDQHVHRFLWRDFQVERPPDVYIKTVLTFGDKPAPAMAQIALAKTVEEGAAKHPEAARILKCNTYMDDICISTQTVKEMKEVTDSIDKILAEGGFNVKGWLSSHPLGEVPGNEKEGQKPLLRDETTEKVLGVVWNHKEDTLSYKVNLKGDMTRSQTKGTEPESLTKRKIMSQVASIFDPIGFASALTIRAKIGLQKLWQQGLDWDTELPEEDQTAWYQLFREMEQLNHVSFERCLSPPMPTGRPVLCIFSDASEDAFGSSAYLRWPTTSGDKYEVRFVTAKSRVAPLKQLTIPRLELQAAVIAARLGQTIMEELSMQVEKVVYLTDSMIALSWIKGQARKFKPFVSARVGEVQTLTDPAQWFHIPGELNVADDVSRGIPVDQLMDRWRQGPEFLTLSEDKWPLTEFETDQEAEKEQRKVNKIILVSTAKVIDCERISEWVKLVRVTAYVFRFLKNLKEKCKDQKERRNQPDEVKQSNTSLTLMELEESERYWIQEAQKSLTDQYENGEFKTLSPFVKDNIIRVGGRLKGDIVSYETAHPALLPQKHHISKLITEHYHNRGHSGVAATAAKVRRKFWILGVHRLAKSTKYKCVTCRIMEHKVETQRMADLPKERIAPYTPPFYYTSCDYFGPINVKVGRNKTTKHYGVIFTCMNTRAVHLELAVDCSSMEFLQVLRRFFSLRGQPLYILSDNGSQFVGAEKELRLMLQGWKQEELQEFCAGRGTKWRFTTPAAPHQNGCSESLVKSCKIALKRAIGDQVLTPFELHTYLQDVANLVNQRPIGRIPNDPDDGSYLCPNDMLLGRASREVPQGPFRETRNPKHRVEFIQKIVDSFWKRWTRDVLPLLVPRRKWDANRRNVCVDDIVMLVDDNAVRGKWTIGRVVEVYPGSDGKVRNIKVKTASAEYRRPIGKMAVIYPAEGYED